MIHWQTIKDIVIDIFYPQSLYISFKMERNEDADGDIAGKKIYGANIVKINLKSEPIYTKNLNNFKILYSPNNSIIMMKSNKDCIIDYENNAFFYRLTPVYGKWDGKEEDLRMNSKMFDNAYETLMNKDVDKISCLILKNMLNEDVSLCYKKPLNK